MATKTLLIKIHLDKNIAKSDLYLRHLLVDTLESRNIGEVIEETSAEQVLEVVVQVAGHKEIEGEIKDLLMSLGFDDFDIQDISIDDE